MIFSVVSYLKVFMLFFAILIVMFAQVFDVISPNDLPEYRYVGRYMGNILTTLRLALGDFSFEVLDDNGPGMASLSARQHWIFWVFWVIINIFSSLIFLNFIIAEVSNCYSIIKADIDALNYLERT